MNILITGGTGFIGRKLCQSLISKGHNLTVLSRKPEKVPALCGNQVQALGDLNNLSEKNHFDSIINLAGEGIVDARWSKKRKQILIDSRIKVTEQLIAFINKAQQKPSVLISSSAVGYYGNQGSKILTENCMAINDNFAHQLCTLWEESAIKAEDFGLRVCILRTGLVIGNDGGFLAKMLPSFKLGLGGKIANGQQWMSWIHRGDLIEIITKMLDSPDMKGIYNSTAPNPVSNQDFTDCLAKKLHRPAIFSVPAFILKPMLGEMAELLLGGQRVIPARLQEINFQFQFNTLDEALNDVL